MNATPTEPRTGPTQIIQRGVAVALVLIGLAGASGVMAQEARTDGPEGSEVGHGGYPWQNRGQFYVEGMFGAAAVDIEPEGGGADVSQTDLVSGVSVGYLMEDWLSFQAGYGYIGGDQKTSLYSVGVRNLLSYEPINAFLSLDAELYSPDVGDTHFGIAPGVGAEVMLNQHLRAGLRYQRDLIFADDNISIHRFAAHLQLRF